MDNENTFEPTLLIAFVLGILFFALTSAARLISFSILGVCHG